MFVFSYQTEAQKEKDASEVQVDADSIAGMVTGTSSILHTDVVRHDGF